MAKYERMSGVMTVLLIVEYAISVTCKGNPKIQNQQFVLNRLGFKKKATATPSCAGSTVCLRNVNAGQNTVPDKTQSGSSHRAPVVVRTPCYDSDGGEHYQERGNQCSHSE